MLRLAMSHPHSLPHEPEWLAGIRDGSVAAFEGVFRKYFTRLCAVAYAYVGSPEAAEEIVQELFLKLWRQRESLQITDNLQAYLFRAARNASLNHLKHRRVELQWRAREQAGDPPAAPAADAALTEGELSRALAAAIDALPERCRLVFTMSRRQGLSYAEIAEALGISIKTVEVQIGRALKTLRERVEVGP
jgi:RNA polymerase sigma-70 factor (ECF subfamily)